MRNTNHSDTEMLNNFVLHAHIYIIAVLLSKAKMEVQPRAGWSIASYAS